MMINYSLENLFTQPLGWFVVGLVLMALEVILPGVFLLWLGIAAAVVAVPLLLFPQLPLWSLLLLFVAFTFASICIGVKLQRRCKNDQALTLNVSVAGHIGREGVVDQVLSSDTAIVRVSGTTYTVRSTQTLTVGARVTVVAVRDGVLWIELSNSEPLA